MNASITERIEIIDSFRPISADSNKSIEKRKRNNSILFYLYLISAFAFVSIVLWSILGEFTDLKSKFNWSKSSISVLFSITTIFNVFKRIYSVVLLKHLDFLGKVESKNIDVNYNRQLAKIIASHDKPMGANIFTTVLAIIILIGVLANFFMDNQFIYYKFFIVPTLLFYLVTIWDGIKTYRKLKDNIDKVENRQNQPELQSI